MLMQIQNFATVLREAIGILSFYRKHEENKRSYRDENVSVIGTYRQPIAIKSGSIVHS